MRNYARWCLGLVLISAPVAAAPPQPEGKAPTKTVEDVWDAAYLKGNRAGYVHTIFREVDVAGQKVLRGTMELNLTVKRFRAVVELRMLTGDDETADGKVLAVSMKQFLGKEQALEMHGAVEDEELHVTVQSQNGKNLDKREPWSNHVVGLYRQERIFRDRKVKPGDQFDYQSFSPEATTLLTIRARVIDYEDVALPGSGKKEHLLRVEEKPEPVQGVQLPGLTLWLNDKLMPVRSEVDMPGLGDLVLIRSSRQTAKGPTELATMTDIGVTQLIPLDRVIIRPYGTREVVYHITVKGDKEPTTTFAHDSRQTIENVDGNSFDVRVQARRQPRELPQPGMAAPEYLKSCYFIKCDDPKVQEHAAAAVGGETDSWGQALAIERWVNRNMQKQDYTEAFATADHVARTLEGDCTEYAVLTAAMCRAVGIPARTAVGLLYVTDPKNRPVMGFHMWTEVFVRGQWMSIDATLGQGFVDASHLKISDQSWYNVQSLTPLLPLLRVLGKVRIQVVEVDGR